MKDTLPKVTDIVSLLNDPSKEDIALIEKAYIFAELAHKDHKRYSGEPYFIHLFETAKNLAKLQMDAESIAAGLLHDTIEDTGVTPETIEKEFGPEILFLIDGVTKLGKIKFRADAQRHIESLRKLFVATAQDVRVLIIKLADRIHNMQTLSFVPKEKQMRIALETLEVYAPLAHRLGMRQMNRELEDLAFAYTNPKAYAETKQLLSDVTSKHAEESLSKFLNSIKKALAASGLTNFKSDYRVKGIYSLCKKLERKKDISTIYDLLAIRIIVETESDCYKALGIMHANFRPLLGRIKDYIAVPKPNGYRSLHTTVFMGNGSIIEIQIRTNEMHKEAEFGIASHLAYKEGLSTSKLGANMLWIRKLLPSPGRLFRSKIEDHHKESLSVPEWIKQLADHHTETEPTDEFMENLKTDFFEHRLFAFTPKGDVIDLPINSSPVDFAYAIHSDIGNHVFGAKVNNKLVSLDTPLENGDIVEIITKASSKPSRKWLDFTKTTLARRHIRTTLNISAPGA
jgi:GTP pyrophosphokinase